MVETPRNPYRPGVGQRPTVLAGRGPQIARFAATLRSAPDIPANVRIEGLRGVGKSVLLSEMREVARQHDWATSLFELEPRHNTEEALLVILSDRAQASVREMSAAARMKHAIGTAAGASRAVGFELGDVTARFDPTAIQRGQATLAEQLLSAVNAALAAGKHGYVVLLDEAQVLGDETGRDGEHPLSLMMAAVSAIQRTGAPLGLVLCGLPTLARNLLRARTYTERMFRGERVESLSPEEARLAFVGPLENTGMSAADALVARVLEELVPERRRAGVRVRVNALAGARGDFALLRQVWINLLDNALKFTAGAGEPCVEIGCRPGVDETDYWIADNGAGFDMRYRDKLFQVFERLHPGEYPGSGIGLAIVRRAVEAHGGRVWAEGEPGKGATFSFALPVRRRAEAAS